MVLNLAKLYHVQHQEYKEDIPFWLSLAEEQGGSILELGCGTGRITVPLLQNGHIVTGFDNDPEMLEFINSITDGNKNLELVEADFVEFWDYKEYSLVILPCNTFSTLNAEKRRELLSNVFLNMAPGSIFCTSIINPNLICDLPDSEEPEAEMEVVHPDTGNPLIISAEWKSDESKFYLTWHYDHLLPDGKVERVSQSTEHHKVSTEDLKREFIEAEFDIELIGDFEGNEFTEDSQFLIIKAKK